MTTTGTDTERLSEYERAICYYTIPTVTRPLTFSSIALFGVLLLGAVFSLAYGVRTDSASWRLWGGVAVAVVAVGGVLWFLLRAVINEIREQSALAEAQGVPNVESGFDELPDPFKGHLLLRYSMHREGPEVEITDNKSNAQYRAVAKDAGKTWDVTCVDDGAAIHVESVRGDHSFAFDVGRPGEFQVSRGEQGTAFLSKRFSFGPSSVRIRCEGDPAQVLSFREGGIYSGDRLVGRIYSIRNYAYLDIERDYLNDGTLAFFVTMG